MKVKHYEGTQWIVYDDYIVSRDGTYEIPSCDYSMDVGENGWVGHMSEKTWVDLEDFKRAFAVASQLNSGEGR